ncbi:MAG: hypothetical protein AAGA56_04935 [Myxococcota bacterium]
MKHPSTLASAVLFLLLLPAAKGDGCVSDEVVIGDDAQSSNNSDPDGSSPAPGDAGVSPAPTNNPTGTCIAPDDGAIDCYSVPGADDEWMLDCQSPVNEVYWHVYARTDSTGMPVAYMLPRPDATGITFGICDGPDPALDSLFRRNQLCEPGLDSAGVNQVNNMTLDDALAISNALHARLRFTPDNESTTGIAPWVLPQDLRRACPNTNDPTLISKCTGYLDAVCGPTSVGVNLNPSPAEAVALADALNALYGIQ